MSPVMVMIMSAGKKTEWGDYTSSHGLFTHTLSLFHLLLGTARHE